MMAAAAAAAGPPLRREAAVAMRHIDKRFGAVHANRDVNLTVAAGTVHGIVGENGAGKSTLMSILYGFYEADGGEILIEGQAARIRGSARGHRFGHRHGAPALHAGRHAQRARQRDARRRARLAPGAGARPGARPARAADAGHRPGGVALDALVHELPVGERQRLEILKALYRGARILILDEPTAVLTPAETEQLFVTLRACARAAPPCC
jgi:general nucleoside transport system ATP-binding protein